MKKREQSADDGHGRVRHPLDMVAAAFENALCQGVWPDRSCEDSL
jgi:hypothetical protein